MTRNTKNRILTGIISLVLIISTLLLSSCGGDPTEKPAKTFTSNGMSLTLTEGFKETEIENYTVVYDSSAIAVFALREAFSLMEGFENYSLVEYADLVKKANGKEDSDVNANGELTWFEYDFENTELNKTYHYYTYVFKASDAFWMVQFSCLESEAATYESAIESYAKSVTFS